MLRPPFHPFVTDENVIVVTDDDPFTLYKDKQVIQVTSSAATTLDTRWGFLSVLPARGVKATQHQIRLLLGDSMEEDEFWAEVKCAVLLGYFPSLPREPPASGGGTSVIGLFDKLFEDFGAVYRHYSELREGRTARSIMTALLTMFEKASNSRNPDISLYYRKILNKNRRFLPLFKAAFSQYYLPHFHDKRSRNNPATEDWALLGCLASCSAHTRQGEEPWIDEGDLRAHGLADLIKALPRGQLYSSWPIID